MKLLSSICLFALAAPLFAGQAKVSAIVERARATAGTEAALNNLVTLQISGWIEPAESKMPSATILIISRKPCSQRLVVTVDDLVETTILQGDSGCIIRSNLSDEEKRSQIRTMTDEELKRVAFSTRQFFSFYGADFKRGERIEYEGLSNDVACVAINCCTPTQTAFPPHAILPSITTCSSQRLRIKVWRVSKSANRLLRALNSPNVWSIIRAKKCYTRWWFVILK